MAELAIAPPRTAPRWLGPSVGVVLLAVFIAFTVIIDTGMLRPFDREVLLLLQENTWWPLLMMGIALSTLGAVEIQFPIALIVIVALVARRKWRPALAVAVLFPLALTAASLKMTVDQPGVPSDLHRNKLTRLPSSELLTPGSYPSGHMTRATYLSGLGLIALAALRPSPGRTLGRVACIGGMVGMAISRPYLGEHWPTDVIGGLLLGAIPLAWFIPWQQWSRLASPPAIRKE